MRRIIATLSGALLAALALAVPAQADLSVRAIPTPAEAVLASCQQTAGRMAEAAKLPPTPGVNMSRDTEQPLTLLPQLDCAKAAEQAKSPSTVERRQPPPPAPPAVKAGVAAMKKTACTGGFCYYYSQGAQTVTNVGSVSTFRLAKPTIGATNGYHSLAEIAVRDDRDIVEIGSTVDPNLNGGSAEPHLFGFNWVNNVPGCYNGCGFVPAVGCTPCLGGSLATAVGTSKIFSIEHIGTAWWLKYNGVYQAAIDDSDWGGTYTSATAVQHFWEVAENETTACTKMGDGTLGAATAGAYFINYALYGGGAAANFTVGTSATGGAGTDATKFNIIKNTNTYIRGGGPMWQPCP